MQWLISLLGTVGGKFLKVAFTSGGLIQLARSIWGMFKTSVVPIFIYALAQFGFYFVIAEPATGWLLDSLTPYLEQMAADAAVYLRYMNVDDFLAMVISAYSTVLAGRITMRAKAPYQGELF